MLKQWIAKFPASFLQYQYTVNQLTKEQQKQLSMLLQNLDDVKLLSASNVSLILSKSVSHLNELEYLLKCLISSNCLDKNTLSHLLAHPYIRDLKADVAILLGKDLPLNEALPLVLKAVDSKACVDFMERALAAAVDFDDIKGFLDALGENSALAAALTLFDLSSFNYRKQHFRLLALATKVLANPLCRSIFEARLRGFSDYVEAQEPLDVKTADMLLVLLKEHEDDESRIQHFFDFLTKIKPFPPSQKYFVDVSVAAKVTEELDRYCRSQIKQIATKDQYVLVRDMISGLRKNGGNEVLFLKIRFPVASEIEEEDLCSTRTYKELMTSIKQALMQPQTTLSRFEEELRQSRGYQEFEAAAIRNIIAQSPARQGVKRNKAEMDEELRRNKLG